MKFIAIKQLITTYHTEVHYIKISYHKVHIYKVLQTFTFFSLITKDYNKCPGIYCELYKFKNSYLHIKIMKTNGKI